MGKWLFKGRWKSKKEAMEVLKSFKKDYKKYKLPLKDIRVRKKGNLYVLQQWFD